MRFHPIHFQPRPLPLLLLATALALFTLLGLWQLQRGEQKDELARQMRDRALLPPERIERLLNTEEARLLQFRPAVITGRFEPGRQFFIENRRLGGRIGVHLITPLKLQGSEARVLVNRGWLEDAGAAPDAVATPTDTREVHGTISLPSPPFLQLHQGTNPAAAWAGRWPYLTTELYAASVDHPVQPFVILQDPQDPAGFTRQWPDSLRDGSMHRGYAIQWFAFALIALGIAIRMSVYPAAKTLEEG